MPNTGQKAAVLCALGDNIVYTSDHGGGNETITITFASIDNTPVTVKVYQVKQGNSGGVAVGPEYLLSSPFIVYDRPIWLRDLEITSLDDIVVNVDVDVKLAVTINSRKF